MSGACSALYARRMTLSRLARLGVLAILLSVALFVACSSDPADQAAQQESGSQAGAAAEQQASEESQPSQREESAVAVSQSEQGEQADQSAEAEAEQEDSVQTAPADDDGHQQVMQEEDEQQQAATSATSEQETDQSQSTEDAADQQQSQQQMEPEQTDEEQTEPDESDVNESQSQAASQTEEVMEPEPSPAEQEAEQLQLRAEEIRAEGTAPDLVGLNGWLNGEETSIALELAKGNVVLIDFWTYTCINCVRTLPFLTAWDEKYRDHGLVIIGVHTPEFAFEERIPNVRAALAEHDIEYLVAIDNDYRTWRAFQNRWWPRKFLIGPTADGSPMGIRYDHIGEGDYRRTEIEIREALTAVGKDLSDIPVGVDVTVPTRQSGTPRQTRELYAGWRRNIGSGGPYAGQDSYFLAGPWIDTLHRDIETRDRQHNLWYLEGLWRTEEESIVHARSTSQLEDYIALLVRGRTANVVLTVAEDGQPFNVYVELDGRWLAPNEAGEHIQWDDEGRSYISVTENDLYRLLYLPEWSEHELKLRADSDQFRIFAFTFGSYVGGE